MLVAIVESDATSTLDEIGTEFTRRTGLEVHAQTLVSALRKAGVERVASSAAVTVEVASKAPAALRVHRSPSAPGSGTDLPELPDRCGMGAGTGGVRERRRAGYAAPLRSAGVGRCLLLRGTHWRFMADATEGFSALAKRLSHLSPLA